MRVNSVGLHSCLEPIYIRNRACIYTRHRSYLLPICYRGSPTQRKDPAASPPRGLKATQEDARPHEQIAVYPSAEDRGATC
jgi:hypothetical protein